MFISRVQLQFYALKILENCLFQLKWQHQQFKKIIPRDQIFLKALLYYIFCQVFLAAQTLSCQENKWLSFQMIKMILNQVFILYLPSRLYITCISLGDGLLRVPELKEK